MKKRTRSHKKRKSSRGVVIYSVFFTLIAALGSLALMNGSSFFTYKAEFYMQGEHERAEEESVVEVETKGRTPHIKTPDAVKAIYMTSCVVGTPSFRNELVRVIDETEINSVVIDVKDYTGTLSFIPKNEELLHLWENGKCGTSEMENFLKELHEKGVYTIARITVFQDPYYAPKHPDQAVQRASDGGVWADHKGLSFIDAGAKPAWDYTIEIAKEAYNIGFDELNFDYIRYPSDGNMKDAYYPYTKNTNKADKLEEFFKYLDERLTEEIPGVVTSADLFGMVTTNYDDLGIGQVLEKTLPYFDYIAPMVYPSHYPNGFNGWNNPNTVPGPLIKFVLDAAVRRTVADTTTIRTIGAGRVECALEEVDEESIGEEVVEEKPLPPECVETLYVKEVYDKNKIRAWLQDFSYGGTYDAAAVRAQIDATYEAGLNSWMLWDPGNTYTEAALKSN